MSLPSLIPSDTGQRPCGVCGQSPCSDYMNDTVAVLMEPPVTEPMYRVRAQVNEDGKPVYAPGALITLQEAVLRNLPGSHEQALKGGLPTMAAETHDPVNKPTRSAEDRDMPRGEDR